MLVILAGVAVWADSLWILAMTGPALLVLRYGMIAREERYLERKFGDGYRAYKNSVRRWLSHGQWPEAPESAWRPS